MLLTYFSSDYVQLVSITQLCCDVERNALISSFPVQQTNSCCEVYHLRYPRKTCPLEPNIMVVNMKTTEGLKYPLGSLRGLPIRRIPIWCRWLSFFLNRVETTMAHVVIRNEALTHCEPSFESSLNHPNWCGLVSKGFQAWNLMYEKKI